MEGSCALQLYEDIFEKPFLAATGEHYKEEAHKLLQPNSISIYMEKVIQRIESENVRSRKFLYPSSYQKVSARVGQELLSSTTKDALISVCCTHE